MSEETENDTCDFCKREHKQKAVYDGKTSLGVWAFMCEEHFNRYGMGLGIGVGQKLNDKEK